MLNAAPPAQVDRNYWRTNIFEELMKGRARFGFSNFEGADLLRLQSKVKQVRWAQLSEVERECWSHAAFLLSVQVGDHLIYLDLPDDAQCSLVRVEGSYGYTERWDPDLKGNFQHTIACRFICTFGADDPMIKPAFAARLKVHGSWHRMSLERELEEFVAEFRAKEQKTSHVCSHISPTSVDPVRDIAVVQPASPPETDCIPITDPQDLGDARSAGYLAALQDVIRATRGDEKALESIFSALSLANVGTEGGSLFMEKTRFKSRDMHELIGYLTANNYSRDNLEHHSASDAPVIDSGDRSNAPACEMPSLCSSSMRTSAAPDAIMGREVPEAAADIGSSALSPHPVSELADNRSVRFDGQEKELPQATEATKATHDSALNTTSISEENDSGEIPSEQSTAPADQPVLAKTDETQRKKHATELLSAMENLIDKDSDEDADELALLNLFDKTEAAVNREQGRSGESSAPPGALEKMAAAIGETDGQDLDEIDVLNMLSEEDAAGFDEDVSPALEEEEEDEEYEETLAQELLSTNDLKMQPDAEDSGRVTLEDFVREPIKTSASPRSGGLTSEFVTGGVAELEDVMPDFSGEPEPLLKYDFEVGERLAEPSLNSLSEISEITDAGQSSEETVFVETESFGPERVRRLPRNYLLVQLAVFDAENPGIVGQLKDITERGLQIAGLPAEPGQTRKLLIEAEQFAEVMPFTLGAECRWTRMDERDGLTAGFKIVSLDETSSEQLKKLIGFLSFGH